MKGQFTLVALIFTVLILIVYGAFLPALNAAITEMLPDADTPTATLLQLSPAIILVLVIMGLFVRRE